MQIELILLSAGITILSFNLLVVSLLTYKKFRNIKLLFISCVFLLFFIRGVIFSYDALMGKSIDLFSLMYLLVFDLVILVLLYLTSLKR